MTRAALSALLGLATLLLASRASANPGFPDEIVTHLGLTCGAPTCTLCHTDDQGFCGTVTHPFGKYLLSQGVACAGNVIDVHSIDPVLDALGRVDSNCDGVADIEQIEKCDWTSLSTQSTVCEEDGGTDAGIRPGLTEDITYGCSASRAQPTTAGFMIAGMLVVPVLLARRRARLRR